MSNGMKSLTINTPDKKSSIMLLIFYTSISVSELSPKHGSTRCKLEKLKLRRKRVSCHFIGGCRIICFMICVHRKI